MASQNVVVLLGLLSISYGLENLKLAYQWKLVDFQYPTLKARENAIKKGEFVPENNLPLGLEVYGDRMFITVPRWKSGVPASLTYINLTDPTDSPILHPYPNWAAHKLPDSEGGKPPEIVSPFRVRADRCGRLWVLDTGVAEIVEATTVYSPSQVLIYDLRTDALIRRFQIPSDQVSKTTFLANLVVEDEDCKNSYGYFSDLGDPAIVVYSYKTNSSWRVKHNYFNPNPLFAEFNVAGIKFEWLDGVFGMGLSAPGSDGITTLYFHPTTGIHEFAVSTRHLRNSSLVETNSHKFRIVGNRGTNEQSSVAFLDKKTGVYFYGLVNHNAIACWKTTNPTYTMENQGRIYENNITMIFPNDIKVDENDNLWVLSDRLPIFLYSKLNVSDINFRIFTAPVSEAVKGTACASGLSNRLSPNSPTMKPKPLDEIKPPVQALAIPEIPNRFKQPPHRPHFHSNPNLAVMFNPLPLNGPTNIFNRFQSPIHVPKEVTENDDQDDDGNSRKGFDFLINIPVNLFLTVEAP